MPRVFGPGSASIKNVVKIKQEHVRMSSLPEPVFNAYSKYRENPERGTDVLQGAIRNWLNQKASGKTRWTHFVLGIVKKQITLFQYDFQPKMEVPMEVKDNVFSRKRIPIHE